MGSWRAGRVVPFVLLPALALLLAFLWMFSPSNLPAQAQTQSVLATQDTYLKKGSPNQNQGAETILRIRSSGKNRALVQFDQTDIQNAVGAAPSPRPNSGSPSSSTATTGVPRGEEWRSIG